MNTDADAHENMTPGGWSIPSGDLIVPSGQVLAVRVREEHVGGRFVAFLVEIPTGIRPYFKLVDVAIGKRSVVDAPHAIDAGLVHFGQWIELGREAVGHVELAVLCVARKRSEARGAPPPQARFRGTIWFRDAGDRLWGEAVGWVGPQAIDQFAAWCSR